jgi:hypothetical protein
MIWVQSDRFLYENKEYCKNDCLLCYSKTLWKGITGFEDCGNAVLLKSVTKGGGVENFVTSLIDPLLVVKKV